MRNIEKNRGKIKTRAPWFKCFPRDWLEGTRTLDPAVRGAYIDCLCIMYETDAPLPHDDKWMSFQLHISTRLWRALKAKLIAAGKLVETPDGLTNVRAQVELGSRSDQLRTSDEPAPKIRKNPEVSTCAQTRDQSQSQNAESEPKASTVEQGAAADARPDDPHELFKKLTQAANGSLSTVAIGLECVGEPIAWIRAGADLELDVLPVVRALGHRAEPRSINSWRYFANAVAQAKLRRERGLPNVHIPDSPDAMKNLRSILARKPQEASHG